MKGSSSVSCCILLQKKILEEYYNNIDFFIKVEAMNLQKKIDCVTEVVFLLI